MTTNRHQWEERLRGCMRVLTPTEYIVLTMLATYTNSRTGTGARPAAATLADAAGVSVKTVRRALNALVSKGYLTVARQGGGKGRPTVFDLVWDMPHLNGLPGHHDDQVTDPEYVDTQDDQVTTSRNMDTQDDHVTAHSKVVNVDTQGDHESETHTWSSESDTWSNPTPYVDTQGDHGSIDPTKGSSTTHFSSNTHQRARDEETEPAQRLAEIRSTFEATTAGLPTPLEPHPQPRYSMIGIPDDWQPNDLHRARFPRPDLNDQAEAFRDHAISVGRTCNGRAGWDAAFNTWMRKTRPHTNGSTTDARVNTALALAAKYAHDDDTQPQLDARRYLR